MLAVWRCVENVLLGTDRRVSGGSERDEALGNVKVNHKTIKQKVKEDMKER